MPIKSSKPRGRPAYKPTAAARRTVASSDWNVVLRKLGENTIGPAGDIRMVQGAMIPLDRVGDAYAAKQAAAAAPAPEPDPSPAPAPAPAPAAAKRAPARPGDLHRTKALIEAYERIEARREGEAEEATAFAAKQIDLLARFLGEHEAAARTWAAEVLGGADPAFAASMAMAAAVEKTT